LLGRQAAFLVLWSVFLAEWADEAATILDRPWDPHSVTAVLRLMIQSTVAIAGSNIGAAAHNPPERSKRLA
jgi:hypothetical protein